MSAAAGLARPKTDAAEAERALAAFLELADQQTIGSAFTALSPARRADVMQGLAARHARRLVKDGMDQELVASTRPSRDHVDFLASAMAEHPEAW